MTARAAVGSVSWSDFSKFNVAPLTRDVFPGNVPWVAIVSGNAIASNPILRSAVARTFSELERDGVASAPKP